MWEGYSQKLQRGLEHVLCGRFALDWVSWLVLEVPSHIQGVLQVDCFLAWGSAGT